MLVKQARAIPGRERRGNSCLSAQSFVPLFRAFNTQAQGEDKDGGFDRFPNTGEIAADCDAWRGAPVPCPSRA